MKKNILIIALFIGVLLCAVGYTDSQFRTSIGRTAPSFSIQNGDRNLNINDFRGKYLLLNFWKSTDAPSRGRANDYTAWLRLHPDSDIKYVSVNLDESPGLFNEIVRLDSLIPSTQYNVTGKSAKAVSDVYGLDKGLGTLLIAPDGKILAHNPSWETLDKASE